MLNATLTNMSDQDKIEKGKTLPDDFRIDETPDNNLHFLPIRYWFVTVGIVFFFIGGISGWQHFIQRAVEFPPAEEYNIDRLTTPGEGLQIVVMGSSYIRFAFPFDERLDKLALERGLSIKFTRFTKNNGEPEHIKVLLPHILAAKPDIVILQADPFLLYKERRGLSGLALFRKGIRNIKKKFRGEKSGNLFRENSEVERETTIDWTTKPGKVEFNIKGLKIRTSLLEPQMPDDYEKFLQAAQEQGTRVILLDLGNSKVVNEAFSPDFHKQISDNLTELEAHYPLEVWRFPSNMPLTHYTDTTHLNIRGQRVFIKWFFSRLVSDVKKND